MRSPAASEILKHFFARKQSVQPSYSLRAFARDIRVSPSFLSEVMAGKKRLGLNRIARVSRVLDMDPVAVMELRRAYVPKELAAALEAPRRADKTSSPTSSFQVSGRSFNVLRNWYYLAILDLTTTENFSGRVEDVARRLKLHPEAAAVAVRELISHGLLTEENGKLRKTHAAIHFGSAIPRTEIAAFHAQLLDKAKLELTQKRDEASWNRRLISGITCTADPAKIEAAKKMLADCLNQISDFLCEGDGNTEVYHLSAQLFPLTSGE